jgi:hypothetical protein
MRRWWVEWWTWWGTQEVVLAAWEWESAGKKGFGIHAMEPVNNLYLVR